MLDTREVVVDMSALNDDKKQSEQFPIEFVDTAKQPGKADDMGDSVHRALMKLVKEI